MFILDTDHLGIHQAQTQPEFDRLEARMRRFSAKDFYVTIVSFHEQVNGWNAYVNRARASEGVIRAYRMFQKVLSDFARRQILPFDKGAAQIFDSLRSQKVRVGTMDLRIAAIALGRQYTVLTRNLVDFQKIPGLRVEDWTRP